jgi:hypothetical protein
MFFGLRLIGRIIGFVFKTAIFVGVLAAVAAAAVYALFDGQAYNARLSRHVLDLTGRTLTVNGKAGLDLGWPPRIVLNDVRLRNAPWAKKPYMARINRVEIQLDPLKAISGGDSVAQVRLDGADLVLETNSQGVSNWAFGALGAGGIGGLGVLGSLGLLGGTSSTPPPVIIANPTVTFVDGATGGTQTVALGGGGAVEITGGGVAGAGAAAGSAAGAAGSGALGAAGSLASAGPGLGPAATFAGGSEGSHVLVAAAGDNNNPCDGSPRTQQQAAKPH